jgi:hypothetical protein
VRSLPAYLNTTPWRHMEGRGIIEVFLTSALDESHASSSSPSEIVDTYGTRGWVGSRVIWTRW